MSRGGYQTLILIICKLIHRNHIYFPPFIAHLYILVVYPNVVNILDIDSFTFVLLSSYMQIAGTLKMDSDSQTW